MRREGGGGGHPRVIQSVSGSPLLQLLVPVPRCRRDSSSRARSGVTQRQPPKGEQLKFCLWQEGSDGKSWVGTVTSVSPAPASRELSRFVQPRVMAELRLDCSRSFCSQTLIFASRYGVEMFDFTALVYIAGK